MFLSGKQYSLVTQVQTKKEEKKKRRQKRVKLEYQ